MFSFQSTQKANALIALVRGPKFSLFPSRRCCLHIWLGSSRLLRITPTKYPTADYLSRTETASHPDFNPNDFDELGIRKDRYYKYAFIFNWITSFSILLGSGLLSLCTLMDLGIHFLNQNLFLTFRYRRLSDKVAYWLYISALVMMGSLFLFYFGIFLYA